ncbi:MAG: CopA family copper-resistance protein, partial [Paraglaciecola sp.]
FRIGVAETYDVIVEPDTDKQAYAIFAQAIDRSGYAIGSITSDASKLATTPAMDPLPILSMTDMGMEMSGMEMDGMNPSDQDMLSGMQMNSTDQSDNDMSGGMQMNNMNVNLDDEQIPMDMNPKLPLIDVPKKEGPQIAMRATGAKYRLDDPGVGLRNNGRKVLTYADLKNLYPTRHEPKPTKQLLLHLTGNMERYMWSINGIPFDEAQPLKFNFGERIRVTFINDTMMNHPMHLHGVWSDLETGDENHIPRKHTIVVQPGSKISYRVTMNARGDWAYHCHMLYHMMGMFRRVQIR